MTLREPRHPAPGPVGHRGVPTPWHQELLWPESATGRDHVEMFTVPARHDTPQRHITFIHGFGLSPRSYSGALDALADRGCQVLAPSLPGFGESSPLEARRDVVTGDADRLAEAFTLADAPIRHPVVAHSFGCAVAVTLALHHPGWASCLTLVTPVGGTGGAVTSWAALAASLRHEVHADNAPRVVDALPNLLRNPRAILSTALRAKNVDLTEPIERLTDRGVPLHLILADRDGIVPPGRLLRYTDHPDIAVTVVDGTHGWMLAAPESFAETTLAHLADVDPGVCGDGFRDLASA